MRQGEGLQWYAITHADTQATVQHLNNRKSRALQSCSHFSSHSPQHKALEAHVPTQPRFMSKAKKTTRVGFAISISHVRCHCFLACDMIVRRLHHTGYNFAPTICNKATSLSHQNRLYLAALAAADDNINCSCRPLASSHDLVWPTSLEQLQLPSPYSWVKAIPSYYPWNSCRAGLVAGPYMPGTNHYFRHIGILQHFHNHIPRWQLQFLYST